jgi:hypothetical protein
MAITAFSQWSTTAASNVDLNSIPLSDSMVANQLDGAFQEMMAQLANAGFLTSASAASTTAAGITEYATAAEWRVGTDTGRSLVVDQVWSAASLVSLTDAATIAVDMSTFLNATVTLGGNRALGAPTNTKVGQSGVIYLVQDGTGSRTLSFNSVYKFAFGSDPVLSTAASSVDALHYFVRTSTFIECSLSKGLA